MVSLSAALKLLCLDAISNVTDGSKLSVGIELGMAVMAY